MTDPPPYPDSNPHTTPRWVKVSLIIVTVLILALVILLATGVGGEHGPRRHIGGGTEGSTPSPRVSETGYRKSTPGATEPEGHTPPAGMNHGVRQP